MTLPAVPQNWVKSQRKLKLELRDGTKVLWQNESPLPQQMTLTVNGRRVLLTATMVNDQVHLDLREDPGGSKPAAN